MVRRLKINLDKWIADTWNKQQKDITFVDSFHIDELLQISHKNNWLDNSVEILKILNKRVEAITSNDIIIVLSFTLNRGRNKNSVIEQINTSYFNKTKTPPEFYLINIKNTDFFNYIKDVSELIEINNIFFRICKYIIWKDGITALIDIYGFTLIIEAE